MSNNENCKISTASILNDPAKITRWSIRNPFWETMSNATVIAKKTFEIAEIEILQGFFAITLAILNISKNEFLQFKNLHFLNFHMWSCKT